MKDLLFRGENPDFFVYRNGVLQPRQYPQARISTTPHLESAVHYATHGGKHEYGYFYVIDRSLCADHRVFTEDIRLDQDDPHADEVILTPANDGLLPEEVVIGIRRTPSLLVEYNFCGYYKEQD